MNVTVVDHPLIQHKLSLMRRKETPTVIFRQLVNEVAILLGYEVTRDLELTTREIETPLESMQVGCQLFQGFDSVLGCDWLRTGYGGHTVCPRDG